MKKSKRFKQIVPFVVFLGLSSCATVWKERDHKWQSEGKHALLASYMVKPGYKKEGGRSISLATIAKAAITKKDNHPFAKIGLKSVEILKGYFSNVLKMKVTTDSERTQKLNSIKVPSQLGAALKLMDENWLHPETSEKDFHTGGIPFMGNYFTGIAEKLRKEDKEESFISAEITVDKGSTWLIFKECKLTLRFRVIDNTGKPVYQGESAAGGGFSFIGSGITTANCTKALSQALSALKDAEEGKELSKLK